MSRLACLGPMDRPAALQLASLLKWGTTSFLAPFPCTRRRADNLVAKNENPSTGCLSGCSHVLIAVLCAASDRLRIQRCNPCALPNRCQRRRLPSTAAQSRRLRAGFDLGIRPQRHLGDGAAVRPSWSARRVIRALQSAIQRLRQQLCWQGLLCGRRGSVVAPMRRSPQRPRPSNKAARPPAPRAACRRTPALHSGADSLPARIDPPCVSL